MRYNGYRHAGLTHGGFYRHFRDKAELYAEALRTGGWAVRQPVDDDAEIQV